MRHGLTHDEYMDEPARLVDWQLRIHNARLAAEREAQERENRKAGG